MPGIMLNGRMKARVAGWETDCGTRGASGDKTMKTAMQNNWSVFAIFLVSLLLPLVYVIAAAARWIDWAMWLPVVLSTVFVAYGAAIRINCLALRELPPK